MGSRGKESLCFSCRNYKCAWIRFEKPVPSWRAIPTKIHYNGNIVDSFMVKECPLFIEGRKEDA